MKTISLTICLLWLISAQADEIKSCNLFRDFTIESLGVKCKSAQGGIFTRVALIDGKRGTKELKTGIIMLDNTKSNISYPQAVNFCEREGFKLPSGYPLKKNGKRLLKSNYGYEDKNSDFVQLEDLGFREVLSSELDYRTLWSNSRVLDYIGDKDKYDTVYQFDLNPSENPKYRVTTTRFIHSLRFTKYGRESYSNDTALCIIKK